MFKSYIQTSVLNFELLQILISKMYFEINLKNMLIVPVLIQLILKATHVPLPFKKMTLKNGSSIFSFTRQCRIQLRCVSLSNLVSSLFEVNKLLWGFFKGNIRSSLAQHIFESNLRFTGSVQTGPV